MQFSYQSHIGILLQHLYSVNPQTEASLLEPRANLRSDVTPELLQASHATKALVGLSTRDQLFGWNSPKKVYVLTKRAREVVDHIAVTRHLPIARLQQLLPTPRCICVGPKTAFFVWADAESVKAIYVDVYDDQGKELVGNANFDLAKVYELLDVFDNVEGEEKIMVDGYRRGIQDLLRVLIFLELTEPEIMVVSVGKKHSQAPIGYTNSSPSKVIVVDSTWNKFIVRTEGFGVRGHFRMQPHGPGNRELKLIWINAFEKNGYVRKPRTTE